MAAARLTVVLLLLLPLLPLLPPALLTLPLTLTGLDRLLRSMMQSQVRVPLNALSPFGDSSLL
jgi:hypothetical protein